MKRILISLLVLTILQGCAGVNTFPTIARAGDTVSLMVGGSELANKNTISAILTDSTGTQWDLKNLGLIRSVFNVRPDGRAKGLYYSSSLELQTPWAFGHEPVQTVMVVDLPNSLPTGVSTIAINTNTSDNSSGIGQPFSLTLDIIPGTGANDSVQYHDILTGVTSTDFSRMEPAPYAEIKFGTSGTEVLAAASLVVDFDGTVLNPNDIAVYCPPTSARQLGNGFDARQHSIDWHQDGNKLYINFIAPNGIQATFANIYIMNPDTVTGSPNFTLESYTTYDTNGSPVAIPVNLKYFP